MLKYKNLFLRPELVGVSSLYKREFLFPSKFTWASSCLNSVDLVSARKLHSRGEVAQKGFSAKKRSSEVVETMDSDTMAEESTRQSTYDAAMDALSSLITSKKRGDPLPISGKYTKLERMSMYVKILDLEETIAGLKIIHVAGTKGKGSTCSFSEAILRECGFRTGLFTSPHLIDVRERFRLDGLDISEEKFLHYFWEVWNQMKEHVTDDLPMPPLFQFLTLLAFKIFAFEKVDVAIIEVGLGGTRDSTNIIKNPIVCGISPLGMDHTEILGDTLEQIASHKAGIFKSQVPAFTVPQLSEAMAVIQGRASELTVPLEVVTPLDSAKLKGYQLSLSGDHQYTNAALAVALCKSWLRITGNWEKIFEHADLEDNLPEPFLRGLSTARLSGRAQIVHDSSGDLVFYFDGAHSPESMEACGKWFSTAVKDGPTQSPTSSFPSNLQLEKNDSDKISKQILLFNCMDVRDPETLLPTLVDTCAASGTSFAKAIFVPSMSTYSKVTSAYTAIPLQTRSKDLTWQFKLQRVWEKIIHGTDATPKSIETKFPESTPPERFIHNDVSNCSPADGHFACSAVVSSLPMTINWLRDYVKQNPSFRLQVLVTGSLHLVGDVLKLLKR